MPSRRDLLRLLPLPVLLPLLSPRVGRAAITPESRKFLFVFCHGGWDPTYCFAPIYGSDAVDMESDSELATVGGLQFVDHGDRPTVRSFFERFHDRTCILNGFEVPSITHDRCMRLLMTGRSTDGTDDWGSILAGNALTDLPLPYLVMSGPSYTAQYTSSVVRVGSIGQLAQLLDGRSITTASMPVLLPPDFVSEKVDAFVRERVSAWQAAARSVRQARVAERYGASLDKIQAVSGYASSFASVSSGDARWGAFQTAVSSLAAGLSRCAVVEYDGLWSQTFDTHANNALQSGHFEELFQFLEDLVDLMDRTPGVSGATLSDEVTIVVCSEMARGPKLNSWMGKDHYTITSAMFVGGGVKGDRVVGAFDANMLGKPVDLASGELDDGGTALVAAHFGATLLAAGDVDPVEHIGAEPIEGIF